MIRTQIVDQDQLITTTRNGRYGDHRRGLHVYADEMYDYIPRRLPFLNEVTGSNSVNINGLATGTEEVIYADTGGAYVGTYAGPGVVDFASIEQVDSGVTSIKMFDLRNNDPVRLIKAAPQSLANLLVLNFAIYITRFDPAVQTINIGLYLNNVLVGNEVSVVNYIDGNVTGAWQSASLRLTDLNVGAGDFDEFRITAIYNTGNRPRFYMDTISLFQDGGAKFIAKPAATSIVEFKLAEIYIEAPKAVQTGDFPPQHPVDAATFFGQLLGVGINFQRFREGESLVAATYRRAGDLISGGWDVVESGGTSASTWVKLRIDLQIWTLVDGRAGDRLELTISDDLSYLTDFKAILIGRELITTLE